MAQKKIGIIGWWEGKNEGDNYIKECLAKALAKDLVLKFIPVPFKVNFWNLWQINGLDFLIIGGGGLFTLKPPHPFDIFDRWESRLRIPFGLLGIGIQEIDQKYRDVIKRIIKRAKFVIVRDTESRDLLGPFSKKIIKAADLTFLYPRKIKRKPKKGLIGVNLRIWNFDKVRTYDNQAWTKAINNLPGERKTIPLSFLEGIDDREAMANIQGEKQQKFSLSLYKDIEVMIGMRLHSLIFAVQNGIPVIGIAYTPKIERFFAELGLTQFCLSLDDYQKLAEKFQKALSQQKIISQKLKKYSFKANHDIVSCVENMVKKQRKA